MYNESLGGVYTKYVPRGAKSECRCGISPWTDARNKTLIASIQPGPRGSPGAADSKIQAYDFRVTLTNDTANAVPLSRPEGYDPAQFEYLRRLHALSPLKPSMMGLAGGRWCLMPTRQGNRGGFSKTDLNGEDLTGPGFAWDYPSGHWTQRQQIWQRYVHYIKCYVHYIKSHLWFLRSDSSVAPSIREAVGRWGWPKDEFKATDNFPHALYIREARRLVYP